MLSPLSALMITKNLAKSKVFSLVSCILTAAEDIVYGIGGASHGVAYRVTRIIKDTAACISAIAVFRGMIGGAAAVVTVGGGLIARICTLGGIVGNDAVVLGAVASRSASGKYHGYKAYYEN